MFVTFSSLLIPSVIYKFIPNDLFHSFFGDTLLASVICSLLIPILCDCVCRVPLDVGLRQYMLRLIRDESAPVTVMFYPYRRVFRYILTYIVMVFFISLWSLLFIIPGIIAQIRYSMTFYILLDNPDYSIRKAMRESSEILYGYKWKLFVYNYAMILIAILLVIPTLGLAWLWMLPWREAFNATFYESIRRKQASFRNLGRTPASFMH